MGEIVSMHGKSPEDDHEVVVDLCRFSEGILTEQQVRKKHHLLGEDVWQKLGEDDSLVEKVEAEKLRRIRSGAAKREKAQKLVVAAPDVMSGIMLDEGANARHRIDAGKCLNEFASNGPENTPTGDRFIITIVMNDEVLHFDKPIKPGVSTAAIDISPNDADNTMLALIAADKPTEGDDGEHI